MSPSLDPQQQGSEPSTSGRPEEGWRVLFGRPVLGPSIVTGPTAWYGKDLKPQDWQYRLTPEDLQDIDAALAGVLRSGLVKEDNDIQLVTKQDFLLPHLGPTLDSLHRQLIYGRGLQLLQGFPVHKYSLRDAAIAFWGLGTHFGRAVSQNKVGHLLGHVMDVGNALSHPDTRPSTTNRFMRFHNDNSDIQALLCVRQAKGGGMSSYCSSHLVHNEVLRQRPDLHKVLTENFFHDRKGEIPAGRGPYFAAPIFVYEHGYLACNSERFSPTAQRWPEVPRMTAAQAEALTFLQVVAAQPGVRLDYTMQPGDISLQNNLTTWHARTSFLDHEEEHLKRHLMRLWLASPIGWPLPDALEERWGGKEVGNRGGIVCPGFPPKVSLDPYEAQLGRIDQAEKALPSQH